MLNWQNFFQDLFMTALQLGRRSYYWIQALDIDIVPYYFHVWLTWLSSWVVDSKNSYSNTKYCKCILPFLCLPVMLLAYKLFETKLHYQLHKNSRVSCPFGWFFISPYLLVFLYHFLMFAAPIFCQGICICFLGTI